MLHKVELTEKDMQEAIKEYVRKQVGHDVTSVTIGSSSGDHNMGRNFHAIVNLGAKRV